MKESFPSVDCHRRGQTFVVDQQTSFVGKELQKFASSYGIDLLPIPPNAKEKNAVVERSIRTIKELLRKLVPEKKYYYWERFVPFVERIMHETPNKETGISPHELVYGFAPREPISTNPREYLNIVELHKRALKRRKILRKHRRNQRIKAYLEGKPLDIEPGSICRRRYRKLEKDSGIPEKFIPQFREIWKVISKTEDKEDNFYCRRLSPLPIKEEVLNARDLKRVR